MSTKAEYLLARYAEEEAMAQAATPGPWEVLWEDDHGDGEDYGYWVAGEDRSTVAGTCEDYEGEPPRDSAHIAYHDPTHVLADIAAKRRIVEAHPEYIAGWPHEGTGTCATCRTQDELAGDPWPCATLRALLSVYADRDDFPEEWR